jgi:heme A synthase
LGRTKLIIRGVLKMAAVKSYSIGEFMAGKHRETWVDRARQSAELKKLRKAIGYAVPISYMSLTAGKSVLAHDKAITYATVSDFKTAIPVMGTDSKQMILSAFDPLIDLIQALAYPIAGVMIAAGCLYIMVGSREKGMDMLRNASIGYILVHLSPLFLKILVGLGGTV